MKKVWIGHYSGWLNRTYWSDHLEPGEESDKYTERAAARFGYGYGAGVPVHEGEYVVAPSASECEDILRKQGETGLNKFLRGCIRRS